VASFNLAHPVYSLHALTSCVVGIQHNSNGFDDLLSNEVTTPELTIEDSGRLLDITLLNKASTDARLDVYLSNSLGHNLPGRIFTSMLPPTFEGGNDQVSSWVTDVESLHKT